MINALVFDKQIYLGIFTVPKPPKDELITVYEQIPFKDSIKENSPIDILYFQNLNYGIVITDKMVNYYKKLK